MVEESAGGFPWHSEQSRPSIIATSQGRSAGGGGGVHASVPASCGPMEEASAVVEPSCCCAPASGCATGEEPEQPEAPSSAIIIQSRASERIPSTFPGVTPAHRFQPDRLRES